MRNKKRRQRLGIETVGLPGVGLGSHRSASPRGPGRLGKALKRSSKSATTTPEKPIKPKARALAKTDVQKADVDASSPVKQAKSSTKTVKTKVENTSVPRENPPKRMKSGPPPLTGSPTGSAKPPTDSGKQIRAQIAEKEARQKEAGLEGRRTGKASASGKRVQARRDEKKS